MDYKVNCGPNVSEPHRLIKEESELINKFIQQECKTELIENVSVANIQPGTLEEFPSVIGSLPQAKRKKPFNKKKPVKRCTTKTFSQDEERISDKDISKTRPSSDEGDDSSLATNLPIANSASNSFLERVLNEKKMALLASPEVIQFLRSQMKKATPKT